MAQSGVPRLPYERILKNPGWVSRLVFVAKRMRAAAAALAAAFEAVFHAFAYSGPETRLMRLATQRNWNAKASNCSGDAASTIMSKKNSSMESDPTES